MFFVHVLDHNVLRRYKLNGNFVSIASNGHLVATPNPVSSTTYFWEQYQDDGTYTLTAQNAGKYMCRADNNYIEGISAPSASQWSTCVYHGETDGRRYVRFRADNGKYLCLSSFEYYITASSDFTTSCDFELA